MEPAQAQEARGQGEIMHMDYGDLHALAGHGLQWPELGAPAVTARGSTDPQSV